jgi:hypothetical protein
MSDLTADERADPRVQEAANNAEHILSETNDVLAPSGRRLRNAIVRSTREAPLHSLAIAFLLGAIIARRR